MYCDVQALNQTSTIKTLNVQRWNSSVPPHRRCVDYIGRPRDEMNSLVVTQIRRQSLSPSRKLALEYIEGQEKPGSRKYQAVKSLKGSRIGGNVVLYKACSVFDIDRLRRRSDKRRAEAAVHLVAHDPNSAVFRAALTPLLPSYHLAPRHPSPRHRTSLPSSPIRL